MPRGTDTEFAELVARYHALVCAVAYGATGDRALSEDVAQDTFVVASRGRHALQDPSRVRQWLCAIARHLALNTRRIRAHDPIEDDAAIATDVDLHARLEHAQREVLGLVRDRTPPSRHEGRDRRSRARSAGAGTHMVCVDAQQRDAQTPSALGFVCRAIALKQGEDVHELGISW